MMLATQRLVLREFSAHDLDELVRGLNNINVSKFLRGVRYPFTRYDGMDVLYDQFTGAKEKPRTDYGLAITLPFQSLLIGCMALTDRGMDTKSIELSYWIAEPYWGKGYATEAATSMIDFAFSALGMQSINAKVFSHNARSLALLERLGFCQERRGFKKILCLATGQNHHYHRLVLPRESWDPVSEFDLAISTYPGYDSSESPKSSAQG